MEDLTTIIILTFVGLSTVISNLFRLRQPGGALASAARYGWLANAIAAIVFLGFVMSGGSVELDISPTFANALRLLGLSTLAAGFYLSFQKTGRSSETADITPPAHPSRTPPSP
ncbi:hypothetical protein [Novosphingobium sp.]|uniref:hypothetical protein n=1 Tax=Novosphingobium sp. TaxID=1874826 RepID=UPI00262B7655|nr:hypothetical protein [Novosphingobium sp.]